MTDGKELSTVSKVLAWQIIATAVVVAVFWVIADSRHAGSSALGGLAGFIPNLLFAIIVRRATGQNPRKLLNAFYVAEFGKLLLTFVLFVIIFQIQGVEILPLLAGYAATLSIFWFALLMR